MVSKVGSGDFIYEVEEDWAKLPEGWEMTAAAVAGDSQDRIYAFDRGDHPVMVFDREGNYLYSWGHDLIKMAHAIYVDAGDNVWLVDSHGGQDNEVHAGGSATDAHWDAGLPLGHGGGPEGLRVGHVFASDPCRWAIQHSCQRRDCPLGGGVRGGRVRQLPGASIFGGGGASGLVGGAGRWAGTVPSAARHLG